MSLDVEVALFSNTNKVNQIFSQFWSTHRQSFPRSITLVHRYCLVPATVIEIRFFGSGIYCTKAAFIILTYFMLSLSSQILEEFSQISIQTAGSYGPRQSTSIIVPQ